MIDPLDTPWVPERLGARLVIGARVRVHVSKECPGRLVEEFTIPHHFTDLEGTIHQLDDLFPTHPYQVYFTWDGKAMQNHYAAIEFEVL